MATSRRIRYGTVSWIVIEKRGWYTDTYGLAACVSNYRSTGIERFRRYYGLSAEIIHVDTRSVGFPDIIHGRER
jgi:hypothetical protein